MAYAVCFKPKAAISSSSGDEESGPRYHEVAVLAEGCEVGDLPGLAELRLAALLRKRTLDIGPMVLPSDPRPIISVGYIRYCSTQTELVTEHANLQAHKKADYKGGGSGLSATTQLAGALTTPHAPTLNSSHANEIHSAVMK